MTNTTGLAADAPAADGAMIQLLTPDGERVAATDHPDAAELTAIADALGDDELRGFYRTMVLARRFDAEGTALQRQGQLGLWPPLQGQEAAQVGLAAATTPQDALFPTYREHAVATMRGLDELEILGLFRGTSHGWDAAGTGFNTYTIVIGSQTLHAVGYAMGAAWDGAVGTGDPARDGATIAFFGDGASSQGDVNEALVFAASYDAPVLFYCQNNQWAISEPTARQSRVPLAQRPAGFGIPGIRVDGNDVVAVYAVAALNLRRIRAGEGPRFIEAYTYRMGAHTTADDPTKYRTDAETESWRRRDPIDRLRAYLESRGALDEAFLAELDAEADAYAADLRARTLALPDPTLERSFDVVYSHPHAQVESDRAWFAEYARAEEVPADAGTTATAARR